MTKVSNKVVHDSLNGSAHFYTRDGKPRHDATLRHARKEKLFPSVTSVLKLSPKPMLEAYIVAQAIKASLRLKKQKGEDDDAFIKRVMAESKREASEAAEAGTLLHNMIEHRLKTGLWPTEERYERFAAWTTPYEEWIQSNIIEVVMSEAILVDRELGLAGTVDIVAKTREWGFAILDMKNQPLTSKPARTYPEHIAQLAAYDSMLPEPADTLVSVILNREDPTPPYVHVWDNSERPGAYRLVNICHELWCHNRNYYPGELHEERPETDGVTHTGSENEESTQGEE